MSEIRPRRTVRETPQSETAAAEAVAEATASVIEEHMAVEPEPVSRTAPAQAASAGEAGPVPAPAEGPASGEAPVSAEVNAAAAENAWSAFAEAQSALARGFESAAVEVTGISRSGMAATADAAVALLGARTFAEAIEINAGLARRSIDAMLEAAARLSEIGAQAVSDASKPLLSRFGGDWGAISGR
jgi:hypothetical protein